MFRGSMVALVTPMKNGQIDLERFEKLIQHHVDSGTNGLIIAGTTGESGTLSRGLLLVVLGMVLMRAYKAVKKLSDLAN